MGFQEVAGEFPMNIVTSERVNVFFSEIGYSGDVRDAGIKLEIDRFDQWTNWRMPGNSVTDCICFIPPLAEAA
ncbi:hypothetical protein [Amycolatopsis sp. NPDC059657]|uniref:hypothetical protein n=1 Tax=Amycolatopsis sp. NPDC059657 TaxID=3346899 RepID=UPI00366CD24D